MKNIEDLIDTFENTGDYGIFFIGDYSNIEIASYLKQQKEEIERLNNIIKEVREYVENNSYFESNIVKTMVLKDYSNGILEILDKGEINNE